MTLRRFFGCFCCMGSEGVTAGVASTGVGSGAFSGFSALGEWIHEICEASFNVPSSFRAGVSNEAIWKKLVCGGPEAYHCVEQLVHWKMTQILYI